MTQSPVAGRIVRPLLLLLPLIASACATQASRFPPRADVEAAAERKPAPTADIVISSRASDRYNVEVEAWGERVSAAGGRLCRYFKRNGMPVDCPEAKGP